MSNSKNILGEDLRAWFGKGNKGGVGGGGWDRYNSSGDRVGKCGDAKEGDAYSACLSKEKAAKLGKAGRAAFVKRKRAAQKKGGDAKKGGEQSKGQTPIKVKTGTSEAIVGDRIACDNCGWSWKKVDGGNDLYMCHKCGHDNTPTKVKSTSEEMTPRESEKIGMPFKGKHSRKLKENLDPDTFKDTGKAAPYGSGYSKIKELEERLNLFLEKNVPTNPSKWAYYKSQAKKKFDVYPSAYANGWAAKKYKAAGGKWRKDESTLKLESNLLSVSKPYKFLPGDMVRNIDKNCDYYKSTGEVSKVADNGNITYVVNNQGATWTPGEELSKYMTGLIKIFTHTPRPGYGMFSNECVVAKVPIDNKTILAKNRDRGYKATIKVVHELINGIEVAYLHDELTDWSEGINEYGIGVVNASLSVDFDEKEGDLAKQNLEKGKAPKVSHDGLKIRTALSKKKLSDAIKSIVYFVGNDKKDVGVKGQTIVANTKYAFIIEMTSKHLPVIDQIDAKDIVVRTNHGIEYPETGYTKGPKRDSSLSRMDIAKKNLESAKSPDDVLDIMSKQYTKDNFLNPYRRKNKYDMETTSQVMYNLNDLELHLRWDVDHSEFKGYDNRLPKGYNPKIKVFVGKTD